MSLRTLLGPDDVRRAVTRMAHELLEADPDRPLLLLGVPTRGVALAARLAAQMSAIRGAPVPAGALDTTLYRDDLRARPTRSVGRTDVPADVDGAVVVLVDDVLFTGRTVRAALDALTALGRPAAVRLAVLVDRGHRELPIRPDAVGRNLPSAASERIRVRLAEVDGEDAVVLERVEAAR